MATRQTDVDDVPPPPYSETDIYSTSGQRSHPSSNSPRIPSHHGDDADSRVSSHASSHSEVIYTPPLTPRTTAAAAGPHHRDSNPNLSSGPPQFPVAAPASTSSVHSEFAAAYFESRPAPTPSPRDQLVHLFTVTPSTTPDDIPCPPTWAVRDVTRQDWATFTNCLIPHHTAARNEAVINRKLQAEEEAIAAAAAAATSHGGRAGNTSSGARSNSSSHASAQLDQIRSDPVTDPGAAAAVSGLRREDVEAVIAQWNEGFFGPRGVAVALHPTVDELRMPGAWDRSFDRNVESPSIPGGGSGGPMRGSFPVHPGPGLSESANEPRGSWSFGGITVTPDGISIGDRIVARSNGIRVGNLIADENGIRFGSNTTPRAQPHYVGPNSSWTPPHPPIPPAPPAAPAAPAPPPQMFGPGPGPGPFPPGPHPPQPLGHPGSHEHPFFTGGHSHAHAHAHTHFRHDSGSRGRGRPPAKHPSDQRSSSTSSSFSSSSSTSSASSVGSLPDYEDLYAAQLPVYQQRVASWLAHPDQPVSRADIAQLREEIRSAPDAPGQQKQDGGPTTASAAPNTADEAALKAELKALTQEWRKLKRLQRAARKEKRRERRAKRREEKRDRREQKRERREQRREERREQRGTRRGGGGGGDGGARGSHQHQQQHHQQQHHHHHHHLGPGPMPAPLPWGAPQPFVPQPPVMHTPPIPAVPIVAPNVPNSFPWGSGPGRGFAPSGGFPGGGGPWGTGFGTGWGRGRGHGPGHGGERAFPFTGGPLHPSGAWPVGSGGGGGGGDDERSPGASTPALPPSQALFKAVEEMEMDIARRVDELDKLRNEIRGGSTVGGGRDGNGRGRGRCGWGRGGGSGGRADEEARRMEDEIDELSRNVEKLRVEADAEFARELAAEDGKSSGW
ncbi:hypothetical protein CH63R_08714 [Colletotrichum higginsianum IMI 349063]|uniref:RING finger domain-containing protein n=3 Tax=Colletotrichum higginsianum TaxID=80884 RepID=A0A1B7Y5C1_COLHI|nr:hypothetical protein CH63R_08714 [Colletotrichum higginsianum IMI 349063]OBR07193.1 hypothetical protein CH63R_08714 [Colletotrichum higginsianum IMI 349063]TIC92522.1 hypothetical protein CH35J_010191 [Colletotrichum higginsianum]